MKVIYVSSVTSASASTFINLCIYKETQVSWIKFYLKYTNWMLKFYKEILQHFQYSTCLKD